SGRGQATSQGLDRVGIGGLESSGEVRVRGGPGSSIQGSSVDLDRGFSVTSFIRPIWVRRRHYYAVALPSATASFHPPRCCSASPHPPRSPLLVVVLTGISPSRTFPQL